MTEACVCCGGTVEIVKDELGCDLTRCMDCGCGEEYYTAEQSMKRSDIVLGPNRVRRTPKRKRKNAD